LFSRLFPKLVFNVTGLEEDDNYHFHLIFHREGDRRYDYTDNVWIPGKPALEEYENAPMPHILNKLRPIGHEWMSKEVTTVEFPPGRYAHLVNAEKVVPTTTTITIPHSTITTTEMVATASNTIYYVMGRLALLFVLCVFNAFFI
uniref:T-box domain-containing protein n=1 Tax=Panagrellus redivivus TaxID=6233 RepID=A0A7E4ZZU3_PANRE